MLYTSNQYYQHALYVCITMPSPSAASFFCMKLRNFVITAAKITFLTEHFNVHWHQGILLFSLFRRWNNNTVIISEKKRWKNRLNLLNLCMSKDQAWEEIRIAAWALLIFSELSLNCTNELSSCNKYVVK